MIFGELLPGDRLIPKVIDENLPFCTVQTVQHEKGQTHIMVRADDGRGLEGWAPSDDEVPYTVSRQPSLPYSGSGADGSLPAADVVPIKGQRDARGGADPSDPPADSLA